MPSMTRDAAKVTREPTTTSVASLVLARFIAEQGDAAARAALREAELEPAALADPDHELPLPAFALLWRLAAGIDPGIGLQLARRFEPAQMHFVAHIVTRAATLREALGLWCRYAGLVCATDALTLHEDGEHAHLAYHCLDARYHLPGMVEHYAVLALSCLRQFAGRPAAGPAAPSSAPGLQRVDFSHAPGAEAALYAERLGCEVRFGQPQDRLSFARAHLDRPMAQADPYLRHFLEQQADERLARQPRTAPLAEQVRQACVQALMAHQPAALDTVARALLLGDSALQRQLHAQGANFRDLLDEAKRQVAEALLRRGLPLVLISEQLGFAEPSVLQRACKRWFGMSAGEVRRRMT